jgi:hypothetical protein
VGVAVSVGVKVEVGKGVLVGRAGGGVKGVISSLGNGGIAKLQADTRSENKMENNTPRWNLSLNPKEYPE